ncbi:MAG TPA: hypothetical protein VL051_04030 [Burkholderiaceae bacterium]|nr:hypothetical protein [Burkholderiaceae bacterium]
MYKLIFTLYELRSRFAPRQPARWPETPSSEPTAVSCATSSVPLFAPTPARPPLPKRHRDVANLRADARGNTTLELITRWLRKQP